MESRVAVKAATVGVIDGVIEKNSFLKKLIKWAQQLWIFWFEYIERRKQSLKSGNAIIPTWNICEINNKKKEGGTSKLVGIKQSRKGCESLSSLNLAISSISKLICKENDKLLLITFWYIIKHFTFSKKINRSSNFEVDSRFIFLNGGYRKKI